MMFDFETEVEMKLSRPAQGFTSDREAIRRDLAHRHGPGWPHHHRHGQHPRIARPAPPPPRLHRDRLHRRQPSNARGMFRDAEQAYEASI